LDGGQPQVRLPARPVAAYNIFIENVILPPELEQFAAEAVAAGRYRDFSHVVAAGIGILRRTEEGRIHLLQSVQAAERNAEQNGFLTIEEVMDDADAVVVEMAVRAT
jgi:putative addiction module CopG family antidote